MKIFLAFLASSLSAASIRGTVTDYQTGRLLARALVTIEPIGGTAGAARSVRTDRYGNFTFSPLSAGAYVLSASRRFFVPVQYGQKRWNSSGYPVVVTDSDGPFLTIQLFRYASISGTVLDENNVGLPDFEVAAYLNTKPPQLVASAKADERGAYRIYGLDPASYVVRTLPQHSEEASYLPTYSFETQFPTQAYPVDVAASQQMDRVDIRPMQGQLYSLGVSVGQDPIEPCLGPISLTLASEWGRRSVTVECPGGAQQFTGLPKGDYEAYASVQLTDGRSQADYRRFSVSGNSSQGLGLLEVNPTRFIFNGLPMRGVGSSEVQVLARHKDLAGVGPTETVLLSSENTAMIAPGGWQFALAPMNRYYVSGFSGLGANFRERRSDGWNDANLRGGRGSVGFTLSTSTASVSGIVKLGSDLVSGAPVFLESIDLPPERRLARLTTVRTDLKGRYRFSGLAPGNYRVLATFEYLMPDPATMDANATPSFKLEGTSTLERDLDLYVIR